MSNMKMCASLFRKVCLGYTFVMILSFGSTSSEKTRMRKYNYAFEVWPVGSCPISQKDWIAAAERIGCNETNGYHCVPDRFHTTLIEFCYTKPRILVAEGNCLELAASGILNHVKCRNFIWGCPSDPYFSNEIQKYPDCLGIAFGCFTADMKCLHKMLAILQEEVRHSNVTSTDLEQQKQSHSSPIDCELLKKLALSCFVLFVIFFITLVVVLVYIIWKFTRKRKDKSLPSKGEIKSLDKSSLGIGEKENLLSEDSKEDSSRKQEIPNKTGAELNDLDVQEELESEIYFEDIYLSLLMRRHCRNGAFKNFNYLLKKKIIDRKDQNLLRILTSRDKDGRTLLHSAAEGGCKDIFLAILNASNQRVDDLTHCGHTVLHLACKNDKYHMCVSLLSNDNNAKLLLEKKSNQGWNAAHFAAASGNKDILELLENKNLDINSETNNGLNVLDIACIYNHTEMCKYLIDRKRLLYNPDARGWTTEHFVAMVGNEDIFNFLDVKKFKKTNRGKTVLHICCEYGRDDLYEKILAKCKSIVHDVDAEGWNALHYAAKGGNLHLYMELEKVLKSCLCTTTNDGKTVLHIACINNRVEICRHICSGKSYKRIINSQIKIKRWTAAHYVAVEIKKDGTEGELISVLVEGGLDLQALTADKLTVLGVACEHRNTNLIKYLLEKHFELVGVETTELLKAANETNDEDICSEIQNAIEKHKEKNRK